MSSVSGLVDNITAELAHETFIAGDQMPREQAGIEPGDAVARVIKLVQEPGVNLPCMAQRAKSGNADVSMR